MDRGVRSSPVHPGPVRSSLDVAGRGPAAPNRRGATMKPIRETEEASMAATIPKEVQEGRWAKLEEPTVKPPPPKPRVLEPEHEVAVNKLPRGPKMVAKKVAEAWEVRWLRVVAEELEDPIRGGESFGLSFRHPDGRYGWATWNSRTGFGGGFLWDPNDRERVLKQRVNETQVKLIPLPLALKAKELKEVLAHG